MMFIVKNITNKYPLISIWLLLFFILLSVIFAYSYIKNSSQDTIHHGGCDQQSSPFLESRQGEYRITYCGEGDAYLGNIETDSLIAKENILLSYSGYPENKDIKFELHSLTGEKHELNLSNVGETWRDVYIGIPDEFVGKYVKFVLTDKSIDTFGWSGFKIEQNYAGKAAYDFLNSLTLLSLLFIALSVFLLISPGKNRFDQLAYFFVITGATSYFSFFVYYYHILLGQILSNFLVFLFLFYLISLLYRKELDISRLRLLILPFTYSLLIIFIGWFPFFDLSDSLVSASRWIDLSIDNWLPKIFADQVLSGTVQSPMFGDWLSSDRGPIQTGFYLFLSPILGGFNGYYQVLGTSLQSLALLPLIFLISLFFKERNFVFLSLLLFAFSALFIVNSAYVWPKLLALAYCTVCFQLFFASTIRDENGGVRFKIVFLIGVLAGLSLLSHGY